MNLLRSLLRASTPTLYLVSSGSRPVTLACHSIIVAAAMARGMGSGCSRCGRCRLCSRRRMIGQSSTWSPAVDVWETENELALAFDVPGVPEDKIAVELDDNVLTVAGERERTQEYSTERFYRFERRYGQFARSVALPAGVKEDDIKADYKNGVLEVRVPKPEEQKPKRIQIGSKGAIEGKSTRK